MTLFDQAITMQQLCGIVGLAPSKVRAVGCRLRCTNGSLDFSGNHVILSPTSDMVLVAPPLLFFHRWRRESSGG